MDDVTRRKPNTPDSPTDKKNTPYSLGNRASFEAKPGASERALVWEEVNRATWRLVDPEGSQLRIEASHGQWGGYHYPKALAYVFDVGVTDYDWRIRVRHRGKWRAWGCVVDLSTAKRIAQEAVENPTQPKPSKFSVPLNLVGGERRRNGAPELDSPTLQYIRRIEIGAVKVDAPDELPLPSDDESINLCATDSEVEAQRVKDLADESLDESLYEKESHDG